MFQPNNRPLYTIGYSAFPLSSFLATLKHYSINAVIDVRSQPYSRHFPDFNRETLAATLKGERIRYRNYAREFGARQTNPAWFPDGYLDFGLFAKSARFREGVQTIVDSMAAGYTFCLMCAEKDPIDCHRSILITRAFAQAGIPIAHIHADGSIESQSELEQRLLDKYFPGRAQTSLFSNISDEDLLKIAYKEQNKHIAYRI